MAWSGWLIAGVLAWGVIPAINDLLVLVIYGIVWLIFVLIRGFTRLRSAQPDTAD